MAKTSMIEREKRRKKVCDKFAEKRKKLKEIIQSVDSSDEDRWNARQKLFGLPRDASPTRQRRRCRLCGRSRGNYRLTGLCRIHTRETVLSGFVPGMHKASW